MPTQTPMTELEAVNAMLALIGESPLNTLEDTSVLSGVQARAKLHNASREVQTEGWEFNSEDKVALAPTVEGGEIILPANVLRVDVNREEHPTEDFVERGGKLYDRKNHTTDIGFTTYVDYVLFLPFEELPQVARSYIWIRAARQLQAESVGSERIAALTQRDEDRARLDLERVYLANADHNLFEQGDMAWLRRHRRVV